MESKHFGNTQKPGFRMHTFTRTSMESKRMPHSVDVVDVRPFTRTSMESKHLLWCHISDDSLHLLIEPVWNRNNCSSRMEHFHPIGVVFNRTIGVNLGIFDSILSTEDINMSPLRGLDLCLIPLL